MKMQDSKFKLLSSRACLGSPIYLQSAQICAEVRAVVAQVSDANFGDMSTSTTFRGHFGGRKNSGRLMTLFSTVANASYIKYMIKFHMDCVTHNSSLI